MNKINVACEYDEHDDLRRAERRGAGRAARRTDAAGHGLPNGDAQPHAGVDQAQPAGHGACQEVYSAVNIVRRTPPGPVFYALLSNRRFRDMGNGLFALS
jgi:hypothetical protein